MAQESIDDLIKELAQLRLREAEVLRRLVEARQRKREDQERQNQTNKAQAGPPRGTSEASSNEEQSTRNKTSNQHNDEPDWESVSVSTTLEERTTAPEPKQETSYSGLGVGSRTALQRPRAYIGAQSPQRAESTTARPAFHASNATPSVPRVHSIRDFHIGQLVQILNTIRRDFGRPHNAGDRVGVVTKVTAKRVFLRTDNQTDTNRGPEHLAPL